jgi:hypothetical protein
MREDNCTVYINGTAVPFKSLPQSNSTYSYLYGSFALSTQGVKSIPEFPSFLILAFFMIALLAVAVCKKKCMPQKRF